MRFEFIVHFFITENLYLILFFVLTFIRDMKRALIPMQVYTGVLRLGPGLCFLYGIGNMRMISFLTAFIFCLLSSSSISLMLHIEPGCEWIRMPNSSFTWLLHSGSIILGMSRCFLFFSSQLFSFEDAFCYQQKDKELNMHMFNIVWS